MRYDALLLGQIASDILHALSHRHYNTWIGFGEPVISTGGSNLKTFGFHLSETSRSCWGQTLMTCLTNRDANHLAICPPLGKLLSYVQYKMRWNYKILIFTLLIKILYYICKISHFRENYFCS